VVNQIFPSLFLGRPRVTANHVAADEEDGSSIEGYRKENSFRRARIRGAMDKGLKRSTVVQARVSNTYLRLKESREKPTLFLQYFRTTISNVKVKYIYK